MNQLTRPVGTYDWVLGPDDAPVTLVEYGDFECVHCGRAYWQLKRLLESFGDELRFVFRHFPLTQAHPKAQLAAEAAEAAGAQRRFWELHARLFEHQDDLSPHAVLELGTQVGVEPRRFALDILEHHHLAKVRRDFVSGVRSGVNGTPSLYLNGVRYDGTVTFDELSVAVQSAPKASPSH